MGSLSISGRNILITKCQMNNQYGFMIDRKPILKSLRVLLQSYISTRSFDILISDQENKIFYKFYKNTTATKIIFLVLFNRTCLIFKECLAVPEDAALLVKIII